MNAVRAPFPGLTLGPVGWTTGGLNALMDCLLPLGKPELKGFNLTPLNQEELKALKVILKG